jgi:hypothetical protein
MSNFYTKAINPRTNKIEKATMLDTPNGFFLEFQDGWKYNLKENPNMIIDEYEAINQDGEEILEDIDKIAVENISQFIGRLVTFIIYTVAILGIAGLIIRLFA